MDYEKAYKDALERAREIYHRGYYVSGDIEHIFPELKEPEDELTWLTKYIEEEAYSLSIDIRDEEDRVKLKNLNKALAWLEKQKPTWSEKDESHLIHCVRLINNAEGCSISEQENAINWLKSLKKRMEKEVVV